MSDRISRRTATRKRKNARRKLIILSIFGVTVAALAVFAIIFLIPPAGIKELSFAAMPFTAEDEFVPFRGGAVYLDKQKQELHYVDGDGKTGWGFTNADPALQLTASYEMVAAYAGDKVQIISSTGKVILNKQYESAVRSVRCGKSSIAVVITDQSLVTDENDGSVILVYNMDGVLLDRLDDLAFELIDYGFFGEDDSLYAIHASNGLASTASRLTVFSPSSQKTIGYVSIENELIYDAYFTSSTITAICSNGIYTYNYRGDLHDSTPLSGYVVLDGTVQNNKVGAVAVSGAHDTDFGTVIIYNGTGTPRTLDLNVTACGIHCSSTRIYTVGKNLIEAYDYDGNSKGVYALSHEATHVIPTDENNTVLIAGGSTVYAVRLPD